MNADVKWWPNWYVTRMHAAKATPDGRRSACGVAVWDPARMAKFDWHRARLAGGAPRCKNCERRLAKEGAE